MSREDIDSKYLSVHRIIQDIFYRSKKPTDSDKAEFKAVMGYDLPESFPSRDEFDRVHGELWSKHEAELREAGLL